ncbi:RNA-directed DNA polymerase, eukaryota [Tanacetum coccineum]|uniref:RNA-directed DNA polymerase, eukaryota n=1 Tax=Tanacetum coccineum TaxID=301880 RepID=A0ABQ5AYA8_9ASTR
MESRILNTMNDDVNENEFELEDDKEVERVSELSCMHVDDNVIKDKENGMVKGSLNAIVRDHVSSPAIGDDLTKANGLGHKTKKEWVKELCLKHRINLVALQETKMENMDLFTIKALWAIMGTWIPTSTKLLIISVYAPQELSEKRNLLDYLCSMIGQWEGETMILGDFNEFRMEQERFDSSFNITGANAFNNFISMAGLVDIPLRGYAFTWAHKSATKMSKLDRFLVSEGLMEIFPHLSALCLDGHLSDHRPIIIRELNIDYGPTLFHIFHWWLKMKGFDKLVEDSWKNMDFDLQDLLSIETFEVTQKAKVRWAIEGDENSKYFMVIPRTVYHDLYLGGKTLVERENVGFDLTKFDLCPSFIKDLTAKGVGLHVVDSFTGNHRKDDFTPLETIRRFLGVIGSRSHSSSKGRPSSQRGGINPFGCVKLTTFIVMCKAYGCEPSVDLFRGFFNSSDSIVPSNCPELLSKDNIWDTKSFGDKLLDNIHKNPFFQRLGRHPTSVRVFPDPIFFMAGLKPLWEHEMAFKNFMYTETDKDLSFLPKEPSPNLGIGSPSVLINMEPLIGDAEPVVQLVENTADSGNSPRQGEFVIHPESVSARIKDRTWKTRGESSRPRVKHKLAQGSSFSHDTRTKTISSKDASPLLTIFDDDEGLPDVLELQDANACHLKISTITHPAWKNHLDNHLDVELLDLHDRCYAR